MADDLVPANVRAVLREHGEEVPDKGRLSAEHIARYKELTSNVRYLNAETATGAYDGGVTAADFGGRSDADDDPVADMTESTPRSTRPGATPKDRRRRGVAGVRGMWSKAKEAKPAGRGRGKSGHPWVSTAGVIEDFWGQLAWAARPIPPLARILACQAPTAGILLEDTAKDTVVDRVILQPAARAQEKVQAVSAMVGPPVFTTMIALWGGAATDPKTGQPLVDDDDMYVWDNRTQPLVAGLRFSLMSWLRVGGKAAEDIIEAAEESERLGDEADKLIKFILAPPDRGQSWKDAQAEAVKKGRSFLHAEEEPEPASQDQVTAGLEAMAASSAFRPAPATGSKS